MEGNVLRIKDLESEPWKEAKQHSLDRAGKSKSSEELEAQEALLNFLVNLGGVREDVYQYLLTPQFSDTYAVSAIRPLLCYAAPLEWIILAVEAIHKDDVAGLLYVNEITAAYMDDIPVEKVEEFLEGSESAFDMCQKRMQCHRQLRAATRGLRDTVTGSEENELRDMVAGSEETKPSDTGTESKEKDNTALEKMTQEIGRNIFMEIQKQMKREKLWEEPHDTVTGSEEEENELHDTMTGSGENELYDTMTQSEENEPHDMMTESEEEENELHDTMAQSEDEEIAKTGILVTELQEERKKQNGAISFFQMLLSKHMKRAFLKLDTKTQDGKIFEIMVGKKYTKGKIMAIRKLMDGGMSKEFIFSLLEKDMSEEELKDLCDTLLSAPEEPENILQGEEE